MANPAGLVVVMMLQEEWRRQAAADRAATASRRQTTSQVPSPHGSWLDRVRRRPRVQPATDAG
jgi:hypothetical protein